MSESILDSFLERSLEKAARLARESDLLDIEPCAGPHPRRFVATFRCRGLVEEAPAQIVETEGFVVGIAIPPDYLRGPINPFALLTLLAPDNVFHPNVARSAPFICAGRLGAGTDLVAILYQLHEILSWQRFAAHDGLNRDACRWARAQPSGRFPIDRRPLKWRAQA